MANVLLTWEMGAGLGHLTQLLPVGRRLWDQGHHLVVAVQSLAAARGTVDRFFPVGADRLRIIQGVAWPPPTDPRAREVPTPLIADVLRLFQWNNVDLLRQMVDRWDEVMAQAAPDLIIADFSPTLRLTVDGRCPMIVIGTGYSVPPVGRPLPPIRPWETVVPPFARAHEAEMLFAANRVRHHRQGTCIDHFSDLFSGDRTFVLTIPEFDPYGPHRTAGSLPPYNVDPVEPGPPAMQRDPEAVFLYLDHQHPALRPALQALGQRPVKVTAYIGGLQPGVAPDGLPDNVNLIPGLVDFREVLPRLRLILHHGGLGTAYGALMAGTPQVLFPLNLEHGITSRRAYDLGCAEVVMAHRPITPDMVEQAIDRALSPLRAEATYAAAQAVGRDRPTEPEGTLNTIVASAEACIAGSRP